MAWELVSTKFGKHPTEDRKITSQQRYEFIVRKQHRSQDGDVRQAIDAAQGEAEQDSETLCTITIEREARNFSENERSKPKLSDKDVAAVKESKVLVILSHPFLTKLINAKATVKEETDALKNLKINLQNFSICVTIPPQAVARELKMRREGLYSLFKILGVPTQKPKLAHPQKKQDPMLQLSLFQQMRFMVESSIRTDSLATPKKQFLHPSEAKQPNTINLLTFINSHQHFGDRSIPTAVHELMYQYELGELDIECLYGQMVQQWDVGKTNPFILYLAYQVSLMYRTELESQLRDVERQNESKLTELKALAAQEEEAVVTAVSANADLDSKYDGNSEVDVNVVPVIDKSDVALEPVAELPDSNAIIQTKMQITTECQALNKTVEGLKTEVASIKLQQQEWLDYFFAELQDEPLAQHVMGCLMVKYNVVPLSFIKALYPTSGVLALDSDNQLPYPQRFIENFLVENPRRQWVYHRELFDAANTPEEQSIARKIARAREAYAESFFRGVVHINSHVAQLLYATDFLLALALNENVQLPQISKRYEDALYWLSCAAPHLIEARARLVEYLITFPPLFNTSGKPYSPLQIYDKAMALLPDLSTREGQIAQQFLQHGTNGDYFKKSAEIFKRARQGDAIAVLLAKSHICMNFMLAAYKQLAVEAEDENLGHYTEAQRVIAHAQRNSMAWVCLKVAVAEFCHIIPKNHDDIQDKVLRSRFASALFWQAYIKLLLVPFSSNQATSRVNAAEQSLTRAIQYDPEVLGKHADGELSVFVKYQNDSQRSLLNLAKESEYWVKLNKIERAMSELQQQFNEYELKKFTALERLHVLVCAYRAPENFIFSRDENEFAQIIATCKAYSGNQQFDARATELNQLKAKYLLWQACFELLFSTRPKAPIRKTKAIRHYDAVGKGASVKKEGGFSTKHSAVGKASKMEQETNSSNYIVPDYLGDGVESSRKHSAVGKASKMGQETSSPNYIVPDYLGDGVEGSKQFSSQDKIRTTAGESSFPANRNGYSATLFNAAGAPQRKATLLADGDSDYLSRKVARAKKSIKAAKGYCPDIMEQVASSNDIVLKWFAEHLQKRTDEKALTKLATIKKDKYGAIINRRVSDSSLRSAGRDSSIGNVVQGALNVPGDVLRTSGQLLGGVSSWLTDSMSSLVSPPRSGGRCSPGDSRFFTSSPSPGQSSSDSGGSTPLSSQANNEGFKP